MGTNSNSRIAANTYLWSYMSSRTVEHLQQNLTQYCLLPCKLPLHSTSVSVQASSLLLPILSALSLPYIFIRHTVLASRILRPTETLHFLIQQSCLMPYSWTPKTHCHSWSYVRVTLQLHDRLPCYPLLWATFSHNISLPTVADTSSLHLFVQCDLHSYLYCMNIILGTHIRFESECSLPSDLYIFMNIHTPICSWASNVFFVCNSLKWHSKL